MATSFPPQRTISAALAVASFLALAAWFGLLTGFAEVAYLVKQVYLRHMFVLRGRDALWMIPFAEMAFFLVVGVIFLAAGRLFGRRWSLQYAVTALGSLSALSFVLMYGRLHWIANVLLALGLGAAAGRAANRWPRASRRLVVFTLPAMLGLVLLLGIGLHLWRGATEQAGIHKSRAGAPNVLLIVLDTVRAVELGMYGYSRPTSPNLDRFARRGVRFENAVAPSAWTVPSHASMFTGLHALEHGAELHKALKPSYLTLAEFLGSHGYRTGGFVANRFYVTWETGLAQGFSHYEDHPVSLGEWIRQSTFVSLSMEWAFYRRLVGFDDTYGRISAKEINTAFLTWLTAGDARPFFAFLNYFDAHFPYLSPDTVGVRFGVSDQAKAIQAYGRWLDGWESRPTSQELADVRAAYDASIAMLDREVGALLAELSERGLLDDTLVIITSDHGEQFGEHGLYEHGKSLYRPVLWVPLILVHPYLTANAVVATPVGLHDLPATIADLLDLEAESPFPGRSLARTLASGPRPDSGLSVAVSQMEGAPHAPAWTPVFKGDMRSLVADSLHYIRSADGTEELFHIDEDPWERRNLLPSWRDEPVVDSLRSRLARRSAQGHDDEALTRRGRSLRR